MSTHFAPATLALAVHLSESWRPNCIGQLVAFALPACFREMAMMTNDPKKRAQTLRSVKLPHRSFKVKFKIFRFGFTDFDVFVRHFVEAASWQIETHNERTHTYTFHNDWNITLHPHGDISLYSRLLKREEAFDVYRVIDVLLTLDVRVGENCEVLMHYEGDFGYRNKISSKGGVPIVMLSGTALVLFLVTKTVQMMYHRILSTPIVYFLETSGFLFALAFAYFLYKSINRDNESFEEVLLEASQTKSHEEFMENVDVRRKQGGMPSIQAVNLIKELRYPLENIMAYTRFYKNHTKTNTQHWKDLMEIMGQAICIREVMNRVEARIPVEGDTQGSDEGGKIFRKHQRRMDLIPVTVRGTDLLGDSFETPSHSLNISESGICLLLPDAMVAVGQSVNLESQEGSLSGIVRWVAASKVGNTMMAGIEFNAGNITEITGSGTDKASTVHDSKAVAI